MTVVAEVVVRMEVVVALSEAEVAFLVVAVVVALRVVVVLRVDGRAVVEVLFLCSTWCFGALVVVGGTPGVMQYRVHSCSKLNSRKEAGEEQLPVPSPARH